MRAYVFTFTRNRRTMNVESEIPKDGNALKNEIL